MNTIEAISNRRSVRKFTPQEIDADTLNKILHAGILAPSAKNRQPWKFIAVTGQNRREMIKVIKTGFEGERSPGGLFENRAYLMLQAEQSLRVMEEAPVTVFVINTEHQFTLTQTVEEKYSEMANLLSIGALIENMLLAALEYGIGSLWIGDIYFAYNELLEWLRTDRQIAAAVCLGYPAEHPPARPREKLAVLLEKR
ncbi:MAG: nitroreductase [Treponema sp.]|jgi:nitroreductase|nr:nitroreductase [Treponema sp.]